MIPALQPTRPRLQPPPPHAPLNQQPARALSAVAPPYFPPRTQIEAMPPRQLVPDPYDASVRHPVFFTDRLKRAPNGVASGQAWGSPVAAGYVFNDGVKRESGSRL